QVQAGHAVGREVDRMAALLEIIAKVGGDVLVVLDDEYAHRRCFHGAWVGCPDSGTQPREAGVTSAAGAADTKGPGHPRATRSTAPIDAIRFPAHGPALESSLRSGHATPAPIKHRLSRALSDG